MMMVWQDWVGTLSYVLLAASYLVTNIYWLRVLAIVALTAEAVYFYLVGENDLWVGILWSGVFNAINIVQLIRLARARMKVALSDEEKLLHASAFGKLDQVNFGRLLALGRWNDFATGTVLTVQEHPVEQLHLLVAGNALVAIDDQLVASVGPGAFIGEMAFLADGKASATVTIGDHSRSFSLSIAELHALTSKNAQIRNVLSEQFARDLARKLRVTGLRQG
jgi:hypothetical protein